MSGFHAPGASTLDALPGTRRVLRNGFPLFDSLVSALLFGIFIISIAVFDNYIVGIAAALLSFIFPLIRSKASSTAIHDLNLSDPKKSMLGNLLQILSVAPIIVLLLGTPSPSLAWPIACFSTLLSFISYRFFLARVYIESPEETPDFDSLPNPRRP